ncbi:MAG: hypothetical protein ACI4OB_07075 [Christensenellales bacterium]
MAYTFKKITDTEALQTVPDGANVLCETDGTVKRVPASEMVGIGWSYGTCNTAAAVIEKELEISNFVLREGALIVVLFKNANSATDPTLNVNGTGAKAILNCYKSTAISTTDIIAGMTCLFAYNGTQWVLLNPTIADGSEVSY